MTIALASFLSESGERWQRFSSSETEENHMSKSSKALWVRARGPLACFTRPEMKVERVSYEVMTPSAARGLLEAVLWKPAIRWHIHEIRVLAPIRWQSFRRNEVAQRISERMGPYLIEDHRAQRNTVALRDVDYAVRASFTMTARAGADDSVRKFEDMFERRLEKGQHFQQPYLGCREFAACVERLEEVPPGIDPGVERPLGMMLFDMEHPEDGSQEAARPLFFSARLASGVLQVPTLDEVKRAAGSAP
jgi:CRISPR-associated protein Cas5d